LTTDEYAIVERSDELSPDRSRSPTLPEVGVEVPTSPRVPGRIFAATLQETANRRAALRRVLLAVGGVA
jgi:hypothetical protein